MIRAFWFLILLAFLSLGAALISDSPGTASIKWLGYQIESSIGILFLFVISCSLILMTVLRVFFFIRNAPKQVTNARFEWRRRRGYKALTQGMLAVAAGDAIEARRLSKKAETLLAEPPLTMLLSAQAAQLSGDNKAAGRFFEEMAQQPQTKYLGLSGKLKQAIQDGDKTGALQLAEQASNLNPKADNVTATLFDLQVKNGDWEGAEDTVKRSIKLKTISADTGRRRRAVLLFLQSIEKEDDGRLDEALQHAKKANNLAPNFVPATVRIARLLQSSGKRRKAAAIIEETWVSNPHPHLAEVMKDLAPGAGPQEIMRTLENLANYNKEHLESHIAIATSALAAGMLQESREHLEAVSSGNPSARVCRHMAELVEAENGNVEVSREWLRRATDADPDSAWICEDCGNTIASWEPLCSRCEKFDSLSWRTPPRVTHYDPDENSDSAFEAATVGSNQDRPEKLSEKNSNPSAR